MSASDYNTFANDLKKYIDYFVQTQGFVPGASLLSHISAQAMQTAMSIRGDERGPAIMIQGIMPRSGSVYVGELLRLHPELYAYPHQLWEFPALQLTGEIRKLQRKFLLGYKPNFGKLGEQDFLPLVGAALIAYLYEPIPTQQRLLTKMPNVQYLDQFFFMFPHENLLILIRDGRDLVHSTLRTWPRLNFVQVCLRWNRSARMVLSTLKYLESKQGQKHLLVRYEDALEDPVSFVKAACCRFGLDENCYPYERIEDVRVIGSSKLESQAGQSVSWNHLKKPEDFSPTKYWEKWSLARKSIFKIVAGRSLMQLGYCEDLNW